MVLSHGSRLQVDGALTLTGDLVLESNSSLAVGNRGRIIVGGCVVGGSTHLILEGAHLIEGEKEIAVLEYRGLECPEQTFDVVPLIQEMDSCQRLASVRSVNKANVLMVTLNIISHCSSGTALITASSLLLIALCSTRMF